jgi:hypothetical protein
MFTKQILYKDGHHMHVASEKSLGRNGEELMKISKKQENVNF